MDFFGYVFSQPIQLGFDIATSLTIIGSLSYFVFSMRRKAKEERIQRFDKQVRAVAADQLRVSLGKLSDLFIGSVIESSESFKRAFGLSSQSDLERETRRLKMEGQTELSIERLESANDAIGKFYEELHKEKYNIIPVIDSIEDNSELVEQFNVQLSKISEAFNNQNNSTRALLHELRQLAADIKAMNNELNCDTFEDFHKRTQEEGVFDTLMEKASRVFYDDDYLYWTKTFVSDGKESGFEHAVRNTSSLREMDEENRSIFIQSCAFLISKLLENKENIYAQVFFEASRKQSESNKACKDVLINLSAILKYLLKSDTDTTSLFAIVECYKNENYFDLESAIR